MISTSLKVIVTISIVFGATKSWMVYSGNSMSRFSWK